MLDERGDPLADAWVSARAAQLDPSQGSTALAAVGGGSAQRRVLSVRDGRFSIAGLAGAARYVVRAVKSRGADGDAVVRADVDPGSWLELRLQPSAALTGVVVDSAGQPVPSYRLQVVHAATETQEARSIVDPAGRFSLRELPRARCSWSRQPRPGRSAALDSSWPARKHGRMSAS